MQILARAPSHCDSLLSLSDACRMQAWIQKNDLGIIVSSLQMTRSQDICQIWRCEWYPLFLTILNP